MNRLLLKRSDSSDVEIEPALIDGIDLGIAVAPELNNKCMVPVGIGFL